MRREESIDSALYRKICRLGGRTQIAKRGFWHFMKVLVDGQMGEKEARAEILEAAQMDSLKSRKEKFDETMTPKERDRMLILYYLQGKTVIFVDDVVNESGAEKLRVYPLLYELMLEGVILVVKESELGRMVRVKLA